MKRVISLPCCIIFCCVGMCLSAQQNKRFSSKKMTDFTGSTKTSKSEIIGKLKVSGDGTLEFKSIASSISKDDPFSTEVSVSASQISLQPSKRRTSSRINQPNLFLESNLVNQDFNSEYDKFLKNQRSPLLHSKSELFKLGGTVWHRDYGDTEYYLTPTTQNLKAYKDRIRKEDNKQLGIKKSTFQHVKIIITKTTKSLLNNMGIRVPKYITGSVNVYLPKLDIEKFDPKLVEKRSKFSTFDQDVIRANEDFSDRTKSVIWSNGFEESFPGSTYTVGDLNSTNGLDYWDDLNCKSHSGSYSIWCADIGDQPDCQNYDDYMESYVYKTSGVNVSGYTNLMYKAYMWYDTELGYDELEKYYSSDGISWTYYTSYSGNSSGWDLFQVSLTGTWVTYYWKWVFYSDFSISNYEGAYLDDMEITGDATTVLPNLTCDPNNYTSLTVTNQTIVDMNVRVINDGQASAGSSYLGYYLSEDESITTDDWLFGEDYVTSLSVGAYSDESIYIDVTTVTPPIPPNIYYVAFIIDYLEQVVESNENDNAWHWDSPKVVIDPNSLSVNPSYQYVGPDAGSFQVQVSSNIDWTVSESCTWLSCNPTNGSNNGSFTVNYQSNTTTNSRTCIITVSGEGQSATVTVNQAPINAYLAVTPTAIVKPHTSGSFSVQVSSNISWGVSESCTWLSCSPTNGSNNGTFTVTYDENTSQNSRTGIITVSGSGLSETVTLTQNGTTYYLSVDPISSVVGPQADNFQVQVTSNINWQVVNNCSWINCSPENGTNNGSFTVNIDENPNQEIRTGNISVSGNGELATITVVQQGIDYFITASPTHLELSWNAGSSDQFSITSNVFWNLSNWPNWLDVSCISGQGDATITVTANSDTEYVRTATLIINGEGVPPENIQVTQRPNAIDDAYLLKSLIVFPIPARDAVFIKLNNPAIFINGLEIFNITGVSVFSHEITPTALIRISLVEFEQGLYMLKVRTNKGIVLKKVLIQKQ